MNVIPRILYLTDPDTFASLIVLNRRWRAASETPHLYAHQISRCPSFSISNNTIGGPFNENDLPRLRRVFGAEVKRNLFEAYMRPRQTTVNLISTTASSSAAFPGGEAFHFSFSPKGHHLLALNSSRIFVLCLTSDLVSVKREFKISRRPVSATILDDTSTLAVLSTDHQVNIYDLTGPNVKHIRSVPLDNAPRTITLSPGASVLAAAYEGGIEVYSLANSALSTDRRAVKCDAVDSLAFSNDGTMLLGTTQNSPNPNTVIISAPYYTEDGQGASAEDILSRMWTTQILFPRSSRDCSHATLLPHHTEGQASWTFTHDRVFETFRAVRVDDLRNGTTYFTGPKSTAYSGRLLPCTLPAASEKGDLIAAGFLGQEIWLYGVPEALDSDLNRGLPNIPDMNTMGGAPDPEVMAGGTGIRIPPLSSLSHGLQSETDRPPQWQVLVDRYRNLFVKGRQMAKIHGVSSLRWVGRQTSEGNHGLKGERLVAVAPGGVSTTSEGGSDESVPLDGGRVVLFDFERDIGPSSLRVITIEIGGNEPETLEEENRDLETEVAIFRRRTIAVGRGGLGGSRIVGMDRPGAEAIGSFPSRTGRPQPGAIASFEEGQQPLSPTTTSRADWASQAVASPIEDHLTVEEAQEALDGPYSHTSPRSRTTLYRAATAAAASRRRNPPSTPSSGRVEYRRADGRRELPHESDADNWVPPPPPYTPDAEAPLPEHLQMTLLPMQTVHSDRLCDGPNHLAPTSTTFGAFAQSSVQGTTGADGTASSTMRVRRSGMMRGLTEPAFTIQGRPDELQHQQSPQRRPVSSVTTPNTENHATLLPSPGSRATMFRRRPLSAHADLATGSSRPQRVRVTSAISPISEPPGFGQWRSVSTPASPMHADSSWTSDVAAVHPTPSLNLSALTLSGSNLQQRLNYPVPPTPTRQSPESPSSTSLTRAGGALLDTSIPSPPIESHAPVLPSAEQLVNLQNRYSRAQPRTVPRPVSAGCPRGYGQPRPGPPRAALGAAGRSPSPSGDRTLAPARTLSRSNSRGSTRSTSASTSHRQRPDYRRLDTIQSVASHVSHHAHSRSGSREITTSGLPKRMPSRAERSAAINVQAAKKSGRIGRKKGKRAKGNVDGGSEWADVDGQGEQSTEGKRRGLKCAVM